MPEKMMRIAGRGKDGTAKALAVSNSGAIISGENVDYIAVFSDVAITNPSTDINSTEINIKDYRKLLFIVRSTHNGTVDFKFSIRGGPIGGGWIMNDVASRIASAKNTNNGNIILNWEYPYLDTLIGEKILIAAVGSALNTPSSGNLSLTIVGVR